jgi:signal transduction histidine kinase
MLILSPNREDCWFVSLRSSITNSSDLEFPVSGEEERVALLSRIQTLEAELVAARQAEKASWERATELGKANMTLKRSLDALATEPELDKCLGLVLRAITEQLAADSSVLWLTDLLAETIRPILVCRQGEVVSAVRANHPAAHRPDRLDLSNPVHARIYHSRSPVIIDDLWSDQLLRPQEREYLLSLDTRTCVLVPLIFGEQLVGAFGLRFLQLRHFGPEELELAQALADQATLVLQLSRLADAGKEAAVAREREKAAIGRAVELSRVNATLRAGVARLADEPSTDAFLGHVLHELISQLDAQISALFVYHATADCLRMHLQARAGGVLERPDNAPALALFRNSVPAGRMPLWRELVSQRRALFFSLEELDHLSYPVAAEVFRAQGTRSILHVPLLLGHRPLGFLGVCFNRAEQPELEKIELAESMANEASLAIELTRLAEQGKNGAVSAERNRIACEIHDTLAQGLIGILMQIENAEQALELAPEMVLDRLRHAKELAQQNLAEARRSVWALRPGVLEAGDLADALAQLTVKISAAQSGLLRCEFNCHGLRRQLAPAVELEMLRIGQEALNNAVRHARATRVAVTLVYWSDIVELSVSDDGQGLPDKPRPRGERRGFGLEIMQERATRIGGAFGIRSSLQAGTTITVTVPIREML